MCLAEYVLFTERCEQAIDSGKLHIFKNDLESRLEGYTSTDISGDGSEASVLELKLKALILDLIHFVDVVDQLQKENVRNRNDWIWQKQLRFKMNKQGKKIINFFLRVLSSIDFIFLFL